MSFKLSDTEVDSYTWPVHIKIPDGTKFVKKKLNLDFHYRDDEDFDEFNKANAELSSTEMDKAMAHWAVAGWGEKSGYVDDDGKPVEFSEEAKEELLSKDMVRKAVILAVYAFREEFLQKN